MDFLIILIGLGLLAVLLWAVINGKLTSGGPGGAALTSLHDLVPKDKQEAIEIIMEENAGKRWEEQHSGEGKKESEHNNEPE